MMSLLSFRKRHFFFSLVLSLIGHAGVILAADAAARFSSFAPFRPPARALYFQFAPTAGSVRRAPPAQTKSSAAIAKGTQSLVRSADEIVKPKVSAPRDDAFFESAQKRINETVERIRENLVRAATNSRSVLTPSPFSLSPSAKHRWTDPSFGGNGGEGRVRGKSHKNFTNTLLSSMPKETNPIKGEKLVVEISDLDKNLERAKEKLAPEYLKQVRVQIGGLWIRELSHFRGKEGDAVLEFRIQPSGAISDVSVVKFAGQKFGELCRDAVHRANPLAPPPLGLTPEAGESSITARLAFYFRRGNAGLVGSKN